MGFEESFGTKMQKVKWHDSCLKPSKTTGVSSRHKRSMSEPDKRVEEDNLDISPEYHVQLDKGQVNCRVEMKKQSPNNVLQSSLKQEILHLEKRLQDQFVVRRTLEKALGYSSSSHYTSDENSMPKPAKELIKEIAVLELEVVYLEQYLLSLYRKAFNQQNFSLSPSTKDERLKSPPNTPKEILRKVNGLDIMTKRECSANQSSQLFVPKDSIASTRKELSHTGASEVLLDSGIHRSHSALSQRSAYSFRMSPPMENLAKAVRSCHSQPLSFLEYADSASNVISLAEHLGTHIAHHVPETPNKISEDMIKCMSAIYCKLSDPPLVQHGLSSPISSLSSVSGFSPQDQGDMWSSSFDARLDNPFHMEGLKEFSGPYSTMVEVPWICTDSQRLNNIDDMLQNFRSLVCRLEEVDPRKMKHEEKLAFWINIHNALVMHAFLVYGIPQNNLKRVSLVLKASYNVGSHSISADTIQSSILGCRMLRPGQWFRTLFSTRTKFKARDERQAYAIEHPEPLLHFALCSGRHSDPSVRIYTPKKVYQDMEMAKEDYIRSTFGLRQEQKILLPKIVESFAKDAGLCSVGVVEMLEQCLPEILREKMRRSLRGCSRKNIEWVPHNFAFRYLLSKELVK